jgi:hypothetical protein
MCESASVYPTSECIPVARAITEVPTRPGALSKTVRIDQNRSRLPQSGQKNSIRAKPRCVGHPDIPLCTFIAANRPKAVKAV